MFQINKKIRIGIKLLPYLKEKLVQMLNKYGCSQAEVLRTALIKLKENEK